MVSQNKRRSRFNTIDVSEIHSNVDQEIIEITSDKLKIILSNHIATLASRKEWQTPISILLTIIIVLCSSDFKEFLGFSADTWSAVFIMSAGLSTLWLIKTLIKLKNVSTIEDVLNAAKNKF